LDIGGIDFHFQRPRLPEATATVTVEVWMRPGVFGYPETRCTRWTPLSNFRRL
jgi:hypothetical protein